MSETEATPIEALKATHSKEKKELQAKITGLKKSVPNTDKKKKKEVSQQIEKMEADLKEKHAKEMQELESKLGDMKVAEAGDATPMIEIHNESEPKVPKVSKKQKRMEKKVAETKRKEDAAAIDEAAAATSRANLETQSIKEALQERHLKLYDIAPDGDCLYNALAHQLSTHGKQINGVEVRATAAKYMKNHSDDFIPFITDVEGEPITSAGFDSYLKRVAASSANGGVWGGDAEIRAISCAYNQRIEIIQPHGQVTIFGEDVKNKDPLVITYHRHAYALGEHYNSCVAAPAS